MCQITLLNTTVISSLGGYATSIKIEGTVQECRFIKLSFYQNGILQDVIVTVNQTANPNTWSAILNGKFACGVSFKVDAICCDINGTPQSGCGPITFDVTPICSPPNKCCLQYNLSFELGDCNQNNEKLVTFTVNYNGTDATCLPYVLQLDFGDGNSGTHLVNSPGAGTFTLNHYYNASSNSTYNSVLTDILHGDCPPIVTPVNIISCIDDSPCCPRFGEPVITFGECDSNCRREVIITTPVIVGGGANCRPVVLEWDFGGGNTSSSQSFNTVGNNSFVVSQYIDPNDAPINAVLNVIYPDNYNCPSKTIQINNIPQCSSQMPPCPDILELTADVGDCNADGKRKVIVTAKIKTYGSPCSVPTEVTINYGNGDYNSQSVQGNGIQTLQWTYYYTPSANPYSIQLLITTPPNCKNKAINISVPECDVIVTDEPTEKPTLCPCCIYWILTLLIYFTLWASKFYEEGVTILGEDINITAPTHGIFNVLLIFLTIFCFAWLDSCKKCWQCRIARCTLIACILAVIILLIFGMWLGYLTNWIEPLWYIVPLFLLGLLIEMSDQCKQFWQTGKCN